MKVVDLLQQHWLAKNLAPPRASSLPVIGRLLIWHHPGPLHFQTLVDYKPGTTQGPFTSRHWLNTNLAPPTAPSLPDIGRLLTWHYPEPLHFQTMANYKPGTTQSPFASRHWRTTNLAPPRAPSLPYIDLMYLICFFYLWHILINVALPIITLSVELGIWHVEFLLIWTSTF